jgi:hypothetical protein
MLAVLRPVAGAGAGASQPESHTACDRWLRTVGWHEFTVRNGVTSVVPIPRIR